MGQALINILAIGAGGAVGSIARYGLGELFVHFYGKSILIATFSVNVLGSFLIGFLMMYLSTKLALADALKNAILIGFLGAFTTYSTFAYEQMLLFDAAQFFKLGAYALLTFGSAFVAVIGGDYAAKLLLTFLAAAK